MYSSFCQGLKKTSIRTLEQEEHGLQEGHTVLHPWKMSIMLLLLFFRIIIMLLALQIFPLVHAKN